MFDEMKTRQLILLTVVIAVCHSFPSNKKRTLDKASKQIPRDVGFMDTQLMVKVLMTFDDDYDSKLSGEEISDFFRFVINFPEDEANQIALEMIEIGDENGDGKLNKNELTNAFLQIQDDITS